MFRRERQSGNSAQQAPKTTPQCVMTQAVFSRPRYGRRSSQTLTVAFTSTSPIAPTRPPSSTMAAPPPEPDSQMLSSPSDSDIDTTANTSSVLSPPDSQQRATRSSSGNMPTVASGTAGANANGKRPLNTISNGHDDNSRAIDQPRREFPTKTHAASGYMWDRAEDEPGYAWLSKKARDEYSRALDGMAHKESAVLGTAFYLCSCS